MLALPSVALPSLVLAGCAALVLLGAAVQVTAGAGLSVVAGTCLLLWFGPATGLPLLLGLNVLVSVVATACGGWRMRWGDVALASSATLLGCVIAGWLPPLPGGWLKAMTAGVLVLIALPRPPTPDAPPSATSAALGVALAGMVTGALTVWTATPGPLTPVALARAGRSGADIRRAMQPISLLGYGVALVRIGLPPSGAPGTTALGCLMGAALLGTGLGFRLRRRVDPAQVVGLIRAVAVVAAALLVASLAR